MKPVFATLIAATFVLVACSSSDDDSASDMPTNPGIAEGEPNPSIPNDGTSIPAPDLDQEPLSNTPGGDTSAVAGYWDGSTGDGGERYFVITDNGLWTEYFLTYEGDVAGNCYWKSETQTLTPEDPANDAYSLADGRALILKVDSAGLALNVEYTLEERSPEIWPAVVGRVPQDLPLCS